MQETRTLIRQEIELARMEITRKISRAGKDAALMAGGSGYGLCRVPGPGGGRHLRIGKRSSLVGISSDRGHLLMGVGFSLIIWARKDLQQVNVAPQETIASLKEDQEWAKEKIS